MENAIEKIKSAIEAQAIKEKELSDKIREAETKLNTALAKLEEAKSNATYDNFVNADKEAQRAQRDKEFYAAALENFKNQPSASQEENKKILGAIDKEIKAVYEEWMRETLPLSEKLEKISAQTRQKIVALSEMEKTWKITVMKEKGPFDTRIECLLSINQMENKGRSAKTQLEFNKSVRNGGLIK